MTTVPYAGDRLVQPNAMPGVRQNISTNSDMFGGAQARALQGLGQDLQQVSNVAFRAADRAIDVIDAEDTRKAREAWAAAQADTEVATEEARARKGVEVAPKDKPSVSQDYGDKLRNIYGRHTQGLSQNARTKFDAMWGPNTTVRMGQIARHEREQLDVVDIQASEVNVVTAQKQWAEDPLSPDVVDNAKRNIGAEMAYIGKKKKLAPEVVQQNLDAEITKGHMNSISALIAADKAGAAQSYFDKYQKEIDPRVRSEVAAKLQDQTETAKSQDVADVTFGVFKDDTEGALAYIRSRYSGKLEEKAIDQYKARAVEFAHAQAKLEDQKFNAALGKILKAASPVEALDAAMKSDVKAENQLRLVNVARGMGRAERGDSGNPAGAFRVQELIDKGEVATPEMAQFAALERGCSKEEVSSVVKYFNNGGIEGGVRASNLNSIIDDFDKDMSGDDRALLSKSLVEDLKRQAPGKPVTSEDLRQMVAARMAKGKVKGDWFGETAFKAIKAGKIEAWLPSITSDEEKLLRVEIQQYSGIPGDRFSPEQLRAFKKYKMGLPLGVTQQVPGKAAVKAKAPAATGLSAPQRTAVDRVDAIFNNSGTE